MAGTLLSSKSIFLSSYHVCKFNFLISDNNYYGLYRNQVILVWKGTANLCWEETAGINKANHVLVFLHVFIGH